MFVSTTIFSTSNPMLFLFGRNDGALNINFIKLQGLWNCNPPLAANLVNIQFDTDHNSLVIQFIKNDEKTYSEEEKEAFIKKLKNKTIDHFRKIFPFVPLRFNWHKIIEIELLTTKEETITRSKKYSNKRIPDIINNIISKDNATNIDVAIAAFIVHWNAYYTTTLPYLKLTDTTFNKTTKKIEFQYVLDETHPQWKIFSKEIGAEKGMAIIKDSTIEFFTGRFANIPETFKWADILKIEIFSEQTKKLFSIYQNNSIKIL